jgi:hypothetical protein
VKNGGNAMVRAEPGVLGGPSHRMTLDSDRHSGHGLPDLPAGRIADHNVRWREARGLAGEASSSVGGGASTMDRSTYG